MWTDLIEILGRAQPIGNGCNEQSAEAYSWIKIPFSMDNSDNALTLAKVKSGGGKSKNVRQRGR